MSFSSGVSLWTNGIVPYVIKEGHQNRDSILASFNRFNTMCKNVRFIPRTTEDEFIFVDRIDGQGQYTTWTGRRIGNSYTVNITMDDTRNDHEFGHVLGLEHEHDRQDATFFMINPKNMDKDKKPGLGGEPRRMLELFDQNSFMSYWKESTNFYSINDPSDRNIGETQKQMRAQDAAVIDLLYSGKPLTDYPIVPDYTKYGYPNFAVSIMGYPSDNRNLDVPTTVNPILGHETTAPIFSTNPLFPGVVVGMNIQYGGNTMETVTSTAGMRLRTWWRENVEGTPGGLKVVAPVLFYRQNFQNPNVAYIFQFWSGGVGDGLWMSYKPYPPSGAPWVSDNWANYFNLRNGSQRKIIDLPQRVGVSAVQFDGSIYIATSEAPVSASMRVWKMNVVDFFTEGDMKLTFLPGKGDPQSRSIDGGAKGSPTLVAFKDRLWAFWWGAPADPSVPTDGIFYAFLKKGDTQFSDQYRLPGVAYVSNHVARPSFAVMPSLTTGEDQFLVVAFTHTDGTLRHAQISTDSTGDYLMPQPLQILSGANPVSEVSVFCLEKRIHFVWVANEDRKSVKFTRYYEYSDRQ